LLSSDRTAERKIKEIILAARVEGTLSKDEILALYLNQIDLGARSFGVAAAAQSYFNKTLEELNAQEAAFLAVHPKAPYSYHPVKNYEKAIGRRNDILGLMRRNGYLTDEEYEVARNSPILSVQNGDFASFRSTMPSRDYFTDEIRRQLSRDFGEEEFFNGGLTIRATMDPELQKVAAESLQRGLEQFDRGTKRWRGTKWKLEPEQLVSETAWRDALADIPIARDITLESKWLPAVVLEIADQSLTLGIEGWEEGDPTPTVPRKDISWIKGNFFDNFELGDVVHVRRMEADSDRSFIRWTLRQVPEVQGAFVAMDVNTGRVLSMQGGFSYQHSVFNRATQAARQPGSSFKPFVYASALDSGFTPATIVVDAPIEVQSNDGIWRPKNASNQFYGPTPLRTGIEQSRNLMTIRLGQEIGMDTVASYAERFGVYERMNPFLANALGAQESTLFKMVAAYAMFANGGERVEPTLVDRVQNRWGETVFRHDQRFCEDCQLASLDPGFAPKIFSNRERVMDAITAYQLTSMMEGVVTRGTAKGKVKLGVPVAGKTGTTNDSKDVWFVGFTSNIVAGCYIGYDRPRSMGKSASGGGMCGPVFNRYMLKATKKYGAGKFTVPAGCDFIKIDRFTGARLSDSASGENVVSECFRPGEEPVFGVAFDGGFAMGADLPLFTEAASVGAKVTTSSGKTVVIPRKATLGEISGGGLY